jgi:hypothetical protein
VISKVPTKHAFPLTETLRRVRSAHLAFERLALSWATVGVKFRPGA